MREDRVSSGRVVLSIVMGQWPIGLQRSFRVRSSSDMVTVECVAVRSGDMDHEEVEHQKTGGI